MSETSLTSYSLMAPDRPMNKNSIIGDFKTWNTVMLHNIRVENRLKKKKLTSVFLV